MSVPDVEYEDEAMAYWNTIDDLWIALGYDLPCVDDGNGGGTPITIAGNTYVQALKDYLGTSEQCFDYTAVPYRSTQLQKTYWDCACGPAALAWIYRGLYDEYPPINGEYLPIHGDSSGPHFWATNYGTSLYFFGLGVLNNMHGLTCNEVRERYVSMSSEVDNGLTAVFFHRCLFMWLLGSWQGAMPSCNLAEAFSAATNDVYTVAGDCSALTAADNIYNNLPVLIIRTGRDHYLIAYGYGGITTSGYNVERKNLYFLIMDNGYTISNNNYKPYWRAYRPCEYYHRIMHN